MRLQNAARYLEAATIREDGCLRLRFGGCDQEQTRGVPFEYVDAED
jgi:hypothetical protein